MSDKDFSLSRRDAVWDGIHLISIFLILLCYLFFIVSPIHDYKIGHVLITPLTIALVAIGMVRYRGGFPWVMVPSFAYAFWYFCTNLLNGNYYLLPLGTDTLCVSMLLIWVVFYGTPLFFSPALREKAASVLAHPMLIAYGLLCWGGVIACLTGESFASPFTGYLLGLKKGRLWFFHIHPNFGAAQSLIALFCGIYLITRTRKKWLWALYGLLILGIYLMIPLTDSRTIAIAVSVGAGLLAFLLCFRSARFQRLKGKLPASLAAMVLATALVFFSFSGVHSLLNQAAQAYSQSRVASEASGSTTTPPESTSPSGSAKEAKATKNTAVQRDLLDDLPTLTGRTLIYSAFGKLLQERPEILWKGTLSATAIEETKEMTADLNSLSNLHNSFLQVVHITGIPGLLIVLCFLAILLPLSLRLFFASPETVPLSAQIWVVLVWVLLLITMVETHLFTQNGIINLMFFFAAGMVVSQARESLPPLRRRKQTAQ